MARFRRNSLFEPNPDDVPQWAGPIATTLGVVMLVAIVISIMSGGGEPTDQQVIATPGQQFTTTTLGTPSSAVPTTPATTPPTAPAATPTDTAPVTTQLPAGGGETVQLPHVEGSFVEVDKAALDVAHRAAVAQFTGVWDGVPLANAGVPEPPVFVWESPAVTETLVGEAAPGMYRLMVSVDPDGDGPEVPRPLSISVIASDGAWFYQN